MIFTGYMPASRLSLDREKVPKATKYLKDQQDF